MSTLDRKSRRKSAHIDSRALSTSHKKSSSSNLTSSGEDSRTETKKKPIESGLLNGSSDTNAPLETGGARPSAVRPKASRRHDSEVSEEFNPISPGAAAALTFNIEGEGEKKPKKRATKVTGGEKSSDPAAPGGKKLAKKKSLDSLLPSAKSDSKLGDLGSPKKSGRERKKSAADKHPVIASAGDKPGEKPAEKPAEGEEKKQHTPREDKVESTGRKHSTNDLSRSDDHHSDEKKKPQHAGEKKSKPAGDKKPKQPGEKKPKVTTLKGDSKPSVEKPDVPKAETPAKTEPPAADPALAAATTDPVKPVEPPKASGEKPEPATPTKRDGPKESSGGSASKSEKRKSESSKKGKLAPGSEPPKRSNSSKKVPSESAAKSTDEPKQTEPPKASTESVITAKIEPAKLEEPLELKVEITTTSVIEEKKPLDPLPKDPSLTTVPAAAAPVAAAPAQPVVATPAPVAATPAPAVVAPAQTSPTGGAARPIDPVLAALSRTKSTDPTAKLLAAAANQAQAQAQGTFSDSISPRSAAGGNAKTSNRVSEFIQRFSTPELKDIPVQRPAGGVTRPSPRDGLPERQSSASSIPKPASAKTDTLSMPPPQITEKDRRKSVNMAPILPGDATTNPSESTGRELKRNTSIKRHSSSKDLRQSVSKEDSLAVGTPKGHRERMPSATFQPIKGSPSAEGVLRKEPSRSVERSGDFPSRGTSSSSLNRGKRESVLLTSSPDIPGTGTEDMNKLREDLKHYRAERDYFRTQYNDAEASNKRKAERLKEADDKLKAQAKENTELKTKTTQMEDFIRVLASEIVKLETKVKTFDPTHTPKSPIIFKSAYASFNLNLERAQEPTGAPGGPAGPTPPMNLSGTSNPVLNLSAASTAQLPATPYDSAKRDSVRFEKPDEKKASKSWATVELINFKRTFKPAFAKKPDLDRRSRIVLEILDTEQTYVSGLTIAIENFLKPFREFAEKAGKVSKDDVEKIFASDALEMVQRINMGLVQLIEARLDKWDQQDELGDIFDSITPRLKPYCRYGSNYELCVRQLTAMRENPKFKKILYFYEDHAMKYNGLKLSDYLIMPVQRIPRYCLLLKDLLANTPKDHKDHALLSSAQSKMEEMAKAVNEAIRQAEGQLKLREIIARGGGFEQLFGKDRAFVKQGNVPLLMDLADRKKGGKREGELILCNDILVAGNFVTKQRTISEFSFPVSVLWIAAHGTVANRPMDSSYSTSIDMTKINHLVFDEEVLKVLEAEGMKPEASMVLKAPEHTWLVSCNDPLDKINWLDAIAGLQHRKPEDLASGERHGRYEFDPPLSGTYDGEWVDGTLNGKGIYTRQDGVKFEGHWDARFQAGYGLITEKEGARPIESGWKNGIPGADVEQALEELGIWGSPNLTERDWSMLLIGAREINFKKGEKLLEQGKMNLRLLRVKAGTVKVEKLNEAGERMVLATMGVKTMLGDTSVLPSMKMATADVIADTDVIADSVEVPILLDIFKANPGLCVRFYKQMSLKLSQRLKNLQAPPANKGKKNTGKKNSKTKVGAKATGGASGETPAAPATPAGPGAAADTKSSEDEAADHAFSTRFDIPASEVVITECESMLKGVMKKYGQFYVTQNFICFESTVFGMSNKEVIPLTKVTKVEVDHKKKELKLTTKNKKWAFVIDQPQLDEIHSLVEKVVNSLVKKDGHDEDDSPAFAKGSLKRASTRNLNETAATLTKEDWQILAKGFKLITYTRNEPIVEQSIAHQRIYQVAKGKCRIELRADEGQKVVGTMTTGSLFGEMSFLEGGPATASVIADDDAVEMYIIEGYFINIVFVKYPELAGRFFCYIASVLAERLNAREAAIAKENKKKARRGSSAPLKADAKPPTPSDH